MHIDDFKPGTASLIFSQSDFSSVNRFQAFADFMRQSGDVIIVPIDHDRAIENSEYLRNERLLSFKRKIMEL